MTTENKKRIIIYTIITIVALVVLFFSLLILSEGFANGVENFLDRIELAERYYDIKYKIFPPSDDCPEYLDCTPQVLMPGEKSKGDPLCDDPNFKRRCPNTQRYE